MLKHNILFCSVLLNILGIFEAFFYKYFYKKSVWSFMFSSMPQQPMTSKFFVLFNKEAETLSHPALY